MVIIMKKFVIVFMLPFFLFFTTSATFVNNNSSYIVMERTSKRIIEASNIDQQLLVASTAKILTAITVIENYDLEEEVLIAKEDTLEVGSKVYFKEGEKVKRIDLLYALMLRSANDAASALSSNNSAEFIELMNNTAKKIGMTKSIFTNASGLDEKEYNLSTAFDMALLSCYVANNSTFVQIASAHSYKCQTSESAYNFSNKHKLVQTNDEFIWGKTGYTKKSKRILVSNYKKENMDVIIVTINQSDDWNMHKSFASNLNKYYFITILSKGIYDTGLDVDYYVIMKDDLVIPLSNKELNKVKIVFLLFKKYAYIEVYYNNKVILKDSVTICMKDDLDIDYWLDIYL